MPQARGRPRRDGRRGSGRRRRGGGRRRCRGAGGGDRRRLDVAEDVVLGDPAGVPGAGHRGEINAVLGGDLPHQRRGLLPQPLLGRVRRPGGTAGHGERLGGAPGGSGLRGSGAGGPRPARSARGAGAAGAGAAGAALTAAPFSVSIRATTVFTATVWPCCTRISASTPPWGAGISASTLSVEISKMGSSRFTSSPTFLIQRDRVPSAMDSPIWGMITSMRAIRTPLGKPGAPSGGRQYFASQRAAATRSSTCGSTKSSSGGA